MFFFFNDTATTEIYTLSLHDALPICTEMARGALAQVVDLQPHAAVRNARMLAQQARHFVAQVHAADLAGQLAGTAQPGGGLATIGQPGLPLPVVQRAAGGLQPVQRAAPALVQRRHGLVAPVLALPRSEEHTSELQSPCNLVCRLLLE